MVPRAVVVQGIENSAEHLGLVVDGLYSKILGRAADTEVETDMGAKVSLRGAHAYMPANLNNESADIDDYWFHSPLEGEVSSAELTGRRLRVFPVTVAIPEDFEMSLCLYAAEHVIEPDAAQVARGEDLEGFLWLQGYLA